MGTIVTNRGWEGEKSLFHGVALDDDALRAAVEWSVRDLPNFRLPDEALDLVDQACAAVLFGVRADLDRLSPPFIGWPITSRGIINL